MKTFAMSEPCELRPVRFVGVMEFGGWRVKVYAISYGRDEPRAGVMDAARELAREAFPDGAENGGRYGVGYLGVHDGRGEAFVFADWWADENELHHHVFIAPTADANDVAAYRDATSTGLVACVWDLRVICHEREAWMRHALRNPGGAPDLDAYLADRLDCMA